ncbi:MAG: hypothetical protein AAF402_13725 [Pseudomonadota bacterium]
MSVVAKKGIRFALTVCVFLISQTGISSADEYLEFFQLYESKWREFDPSVVDLYSDDATIIAVRNMEDGVEQTLKIDGTRYKELAVSTMDLARRRGDSSEYSNVRVESTGNAAKISATRYSTVKCFEDPNYYMVVERQTNGVLLIIEEYAESISISRCEDIPASDIDRLLQGVARITNEQLPVMVDSETRLESVTAEEKHLIFRYVLVNYDASEIDPDRLYGLLGEAVVQQSCSMINLKPAYQQGAIVVHRYVGKDELAILDIEIGKDNCF